MLNRKLPGTTVIFCLLVVEEDREAIRLNLSDNQIYGMGSIDYKKLVKKKVRDTAYKKLEDVKKPHSKVKDNLYMNLNKPQEYLLNEEITNEERQIIFALRSRTLRGIRENFPYLQYGGVTLCPLCLTNEDSQEHVLECEKLGEKNVNVKYSDIRWSVEEQRSAVKEFMKRLLCRDQILKEGSDVVSSLPGLFNTGPCPF